MKQDYAPIIRITVPTQYSFEKISLVTEESPAEPTVLQCRMRAAELLGQYFRMFVPSEQNESGRLYVNSFEQRSDLSELKSYFPYHVEKES